MFGTGGYGLRLLTPSPATPHTSLSCISIWNVKMARSLTIGRPIHDIRIDYSWKTAKIFLTGFFLGEVFLLILIGSLN
jgi:hypothetical protein